MKRKIKIQLKPEDKMLKPLKNQMYISFAQNILSKYGLERSIRQYSKLILRQYMVVNDAEPVSKKNSANVNYKNYFNVYKSIVSLKTQAINSKNTLIPSYVFKDTKSSSIHTEKVVQKDKEVLEVIYKNTVFDSFRDRHTEYYGFINAGNTDAANIYRQVFNKYCNTIEAKHNSDIKYTFLTIHQKGQPQNEKQADKFNKEHNNPRSAATSVTASNILPETIKLPTNADIQEKNQQIILQTHIQHTQKNVLLDTSYTQSPDLYYGKSLERQLTNNTYKYQRQYPGNRFDNITLNKSLDFSENQLQLMDAENKDAIKSDEKKVKSLFNISITGKRSADIKEDAYQSEMILHTSVAKEGLKLNTLRVIRNILVNEDKRISEINEQFMKQPVGNLKKGISGKLSEFKVPFELNKDKIIFREPKTTEMQEIMELLDKPKDKNLVFCKPQKKETVPEVKAGVSPMDVMVGNKEVSARASTPKKSHNDLSDIGADEVNMLAERVSKILEKRMTIQKDRRGMR